MTETTFSVEIQQMGLEVNVNPMCAAFPSDRYRPHNKLRRDALAAIFDMHADIKDEGVSTAIPCDVDETDQTARVIGNDVRETTQQDALIRRRHGRPPSRPPQSAEFLLVWKRIDFDLDGQSTCLPRAVLNVGQRQPRKPSNFFLNLLSRPPRSISC